MTLSFHGTVQSDGAPIYRPKRIFNRNRFVLTILSAFEDGLSMTLYAACCLCNVASVHF